MELKELLLFIYFLVRLTNQVHIGITCTSMLSLMRKDVGNFIFFTRLEMSFLLYRRLQELFDYYNYILTIL